MQEHLKAQNDKTEELSVLIVGLGNRQVTPDALGPYVTDNLCATRHIVKGVRKICDGNAACESGQHTGSGCDGTDGNGNCRGGPWCGKRNETGSCDCSGCAGSKKQSEIKPYDPDRRYRNPSGFRSGNHRNGITRESIGVPVIGIGVPTVVDAATIVNDTMENLIFGAGIF